MRVAVIACLVAACADAPVLESADQLEQLPPIGPPCAYVEDAPSVVEGGVLRFRIRLSQPATSELRFRYCVSGLSFNGTVSGASGCAPGSCGPAHDYIEDVPCTAPREIVFGPGSDTFAIDVTTLDDALVEEPVEQMFVRLLPVAGSKVVPTQNPAAGEAHGYIFDNDARSCSQCGANKNCVALSLELGRRAVEGNPIPFTYIMCNPDPNAPNATQTLSYTTHASSGAVACPQPPPGRCDFFPQQGSITISTSNPVVTVLVPTQADGDFEMLESIQFGPAPGFLSGYIMDDDYTNAVCNASDVSIPESAGPATFTVELARPDLGEWPVFAATQNGTATAPSDYATTSGQLGFAGTTATFSVPVVNDFAIEPDETFFAQFSTLAGTDVFVLDTSATATIRNDDAPGLAIDDINVTRPNKMEPPVPAQFTVFLTPPVPNAVSVDWSTADGTARAGVDYIAASGTCNFAPNAPTCPITVMVLTGRLDSQRRTNFFVDLANAQGSTIVKGRGVATIRSFR